MSLSPRVAPYARLFSGSVALTITTNVTTAGAVRRVAIAAITTVQAQGPVPDGTPAKTQTHPFRLNSSSAIPLTKSRCLSLSFVTLLAAARCSSERPPEGPLAAPVFDVLKVELVDDIV